MARPLQVGPCPPLGLVWMADLTTVTVAATPTRIIRFFPLNFYARCGEVSWIVTFDYAASSGQVG